jgi:hypothetical protein
MSLQLLARRNPQLRLHQVDACNHLGHTMLHLDARVHLDEVDLAVLIHQELDRPGVPVADVLQRALIVLPSSSRSFGVTCRLGASSISFWCRRWIEHSRSPRLITLPCSSASTWNSMCRGRSMNFSMYRSPLPKAFAASLDAC